jgi:RNA polymerase sigma-70 factor (ECF subfamily)
MPAADDPLEALVARARRGDRAAFREVVLEVENDLRFYLGAFEVSEGLTEEILQATLVKAYQKLDQYRGEGAFRAWLKAIARNQLMKTLREQKRYAQMSEERLEGLIVSSGLEDLEDAEELDHQTRRLRTCLEKLPAALKGLVEGRYVRGLSSARLAAELARTEIWVRVTLCRVRRSLRRCLEGEGAPDGARARPAEAVS